MVSWDFIFSSLLVKVTASLFPPLLMNRLAIYASSRPSVNTIGLSDSPIVLQLLFLSLQTVLHRIYSDGGDWRPAQPGHANALQPRLHLLSSDPSLTQHHALLGTGRRLGGSAHLLPTIGRRPFLSSSAEDGQQSLCPFRFIYRSETALRFLTGGFLSGEGCDQSVQDHAASSLRLLVAVGALLSPLLHVQQHVRHDGGRFGAGEGADPRGKVFLLVELVWKPHRAVHLPVAWGVTLLRRKGDYPVSWRRRG